MISKNEENKFGGAEDNVKAAKVTTPATDDTQNDKGATVSKGVSTPTDGSSGSGNSGKDGNSGNYGNDGNDGNDGPGNPDSSFDKPDDVVDAADYGDGGTLTDMPGNGYLVEAKQAVYIGRGKAFDALLKAHYVGIMSTGKAKKGFFGSMFSGKKESKTEGEEGGKQPMAPADEGAVKPPVIADDVGASSDEGEKPKSGFFGKMFKKKDTADSDASDDTDKPSIWGRLKGEKSLITDGSLTEEKKDEGKSDGGLFGKVGSLFGKKGKKGGGDHHRRAHKSARDAAYIKNKIRHKMRQRELAPSSISS